MDLLTVAFLHLPRHTPPGADVGGLPTTPCFEFPGSPPAIRWDAQLQFSTDARTLALHRGRTLVVVQRVRSITRWMEKDGAVCATTVISAVEVFGLNDRGRSAPDTHSVGTLWKLECAGPKVSVRNRAGDAPSVRACRMRSSVVGKYDLRVWNGDPLPAADGFPGCSYGYFTRSDDAAPADQPDNDAVASSDAPGAWSRGLAAADQLTTPVAGSAGEYRYKVGLEHCSEAAGASELRRGRHPVEFENETEIPVIVPPWMLEDIDSRRLVDASPIRPGPLTFPAMMHAGGVWRGA